MPQVKKYPPDPEQPLISHLIELRNRLLKILMVIGAFFLLFMPFANELYEFAARPLIEILPDGSSMIATEVASPFFAPFKFALIAAFFVGMPYILHQVWSFIAPGLYVNEKKFMMPLFVSSILLFYCGVSFAYFLVFPLIFQFFIEVAPAGVTIMTDISKYLEFVLKLFFAFGIAFEVPIVTLLLVKAGLASTASLKAKRPYIIVGAFVMAMLMTPPDVISQVLLAFPIWMLYEVGLLATRFLDIPSPEPDTE